MELTHQFTVAVPIDQAWAALEDLPSIAPCFPGATLSDFDGNAFTGSCRVKIGPVSLQYQGSGRFLEKDEQAHKAVVEARGKERRGNGTAAATITTMLDRQGNGTAVTVTTDLNITGRPAQFGRGMMQDVGNRLLTDFADCLERTLGRSTAAEPAKPETESPASAPAEDPARQPAQPGYDGGPPPGRSATPVAPAALDLGRALGPVLVRRAVPYAALCVAAAVVLLIVRRRGR